MSYQQHYTLSGAAPLSTRFLAAVTYFRFPVQFPFARGRRSRDDGDDGGGVHQLLVNIQTIFCQDLIGDITIVRLDPFFVELTKQKCGTRGRGSEANRGAGRATRLSDNRR